MSVTNPYQPPNETGTPRVDARDSHLGCIRYFAVFWCVALVVGTLATWDHWRRNDLIATRVPLSAIAYLSFFLVAAMLVGWIPKPAVLLRFGVVGYWLYHYNPERGRRLGTLFAIMWLGSWGGFFVWLDARSYLQVA